MSSRIYVITQNGHYHSAYRDFDFGSDRMLRYQKDYPAYKWAIHASLIDETYAKVRSSV